MRASNNIEFAFYVVIYYRYVLCKQVIPSHFHSISIQVFNKIISIWKFLMPLYELTD
jgi:hypothetical protein